MSNLQGSPFPALLLTPDTRLDVPRFRLDQKARTGSPAFRNMSLSLLIYLLAEAMEDCSQPRGICITVVFLYSSFSRYMAAALKRPGASRLLSTTYAAMPRRPQTTNPDHLLLRLRRRLRWHDVAPFHHLNTALRGAGRSGGQETWSTSWMPVGVRLQKARLYIEIGNEEDVRTSLLPRRTSRCEGKVDRGRHGREGPVG